MPRETDPYERVRQWQAEIERRQAAVNEARRMWRVMILRAHLTGQTFADIARAIGYTRSRVQQLVAQARKDVGQ